MLRVNLQEFWDNNIIVATDYYWLVHLFKTIWDNYGHCSIFYYQKSLIAVMILRNGFQSLFQRKQDKKKQYLLINKSSFLLLIDYIKY